MIAFLFNAVLFVVCVSIIVLLVSFVVKTVFRIFGK